MYLRKMFGVSSLTFILIFLLGCNLQGSKETSGTNVYYQTINPQEVEWVNRVGGLHLNSKVLFKENSYTKIRNLVSLINRGSNKKLASEEEIGVLYSRARPIALQFKMKNGTYIYIYPSYKTYTFKNGWGAYPRKDKFILGIKGTTERFYSVESKAVTEMFDTAGLYMPNVSPIDMSPRNIRLGENIKLWGDGCSESEVILYIRKSPKVKYIIAKIHPILGKWQWEGIINQSFTTADDKQVFLVKGEYDLLAQIGYATFGPHFTIK